MQMTTLKATFSAIALAAVTALPSNAATVLGGQVVVTGTSDVIATLLADTAEFSSEIYLQNDGGGLMFDQFASVGNTFNLGSFAIGTILTFYINVLDTGDTFFTGSSASNPDNVAHALVTDLVGGTQVNFEDLFGGGDLNYNDANFTLTNTQVAAVPLPAAGILLVGGLGALGALKRRKKAA